MCSATHCRKSGNIKTHNISILHIIQETSKCIKDWVKIKRLMSHKTKPPLHTKAKYQRSWYVMNICSFLDTF